MRMNGHTKSGIYVGGYAENEYKENRRRKLKAWDWLDS